MNHIGIMQGRIYPDNYKVLQEFPSKNWKKEFNLAHKIGFKYLELLLDKNLTKSNPLVNGKLNVIKKLKKKYKISTPNLCLDYLMKFHAEKYEQNSNQILNDIKKILINSKKIGVKNFIFPIFFLDYKKYKKKDLKNIFNFLSKIKKKFKISIILETNLPISKIKNFLKIFNIKVCLDLGNITYFNYNVVKEILSAKNLIGIIHIKDKKKNQAKNVPIGKGDVNFSNSLKALKKIGYEGNFTLETAQGKNTLKSASINFSKISYFLKKI
jgi:L-ribulose-5-phosphate 3-epimerase UlaE